jgi:hypothetical protein
MVGRSSDEVKRELESEREQLSDAVRVLRRQAGTIRRRLPFVAVGAAGAGLALRVTANRVFGRSSSGRDKRVRFPFLRGD